MVLATGALLGLSSTACLYRRRNRGTARWGPIWAGNERVGALGMTGSAEPPPGKDSGVVTRSRSADEQCAMAGILKLAAKLK